jgi:hypothetical protein
VKKVIISDGHTQHDMNLDAWITRPGNAAMGMKHESEVWDNIFLGRAKQATRRMEKKSTKLKSDMIGPRYGPKPIAGPQEMEENIIQPGNQIKTRLMAIRFQILPDSCFSLFIELAPDRLISFRCFARQTIEEKVSGHQDKFVQ